MTVPAPGSEPRQTTAIDAIAEQWVSTLVDLDPDVAIWIGLPGRLDEFGDLSPAGHARHSDEAKKVIAQLDATEATDDVDWVTKTDLRSTLSLELESAAAGLWKRDLNVIASPAQGIRDTFDLMPHATADDWSTIARRLANLPGAVDGYIETLRLGISDGSVPARRQVREVADQVSKHAAANGFFFEFTEGAAATDGPLPDSLRTDLRSGAEASAEAYGKLAAFLQQELEPAATETDGVGRELYALQSRQFLGATIDLDETYEWGVEELARMVEEQTRVASEISPGASVEEAIAILDADPSRRLVGTEALREWMQQTSDRAVAELSVSSFDIPEPVRRIECMIAPTREGGIYYTSPSDDFSRPGRMWWSVPEGVTEFNTWREKTTVFHEGVPGHHLQLGQAVYNRAKLNTWRRQLAGTSGHAEGWALYAERLMEELGYLDDPGDRLGMLDGQRMRAARVVLDIGVHLGKPRPDGGGPWTADYALEFMGKNVNMDDAFVRFEVNRYLGWPGQAPSYKVGQRIWEQIRDAAQASQGVAFDIKEFHRRALDLGGVGLDTLKAAMVSPSVSPRP
ncbi:uncharacterized protein (DUF885 family) [Glaciihabitans tibetensis]|uniref:Uncharacterized protein (DUF885 family) n=1 Tax=Glaciihabitans tibetensis TaxID=1266600 RepID=A0A2T0VJN0_9MICO|nr:DUF885 domain-containing protein [Glaciihabitans tibetensis]PRY70418.1 uncharacterized protein (DUF885 family) [Glaciihabitans tibetensis]